MEERPSLAFGLLFFSGFMIIFGTAFLRTIGYISPSYESFTAISGIGIIFSAILLYAFPKAHVVFGVIGLSFSFLSLFTLGGLVVGFILGLIGGTLGIKWKTPPPDLSQAQNTHRYVPVPPPPSTQPASIIREREVVTREVVMIPCAYCGSLMPQTSVFCPNCGARRKS